MEKIFTAKNKSAFRPADTVIIDDDGVTLNCKVFSDTSSEYNGKTGLTLPLSELARIEIFTVESKIIKPIRAYKFCLKDGNEIVASLDGFKKGDVKKIIKILQSKIKTGLGS